MRMREKNKQAVREGGREYVPPITSDLFTFMITF